VNFITRLVTTAFILPGVVIPTMTPPAEAATNPETGAYCSTQMAYDAFRQCMGVAHLPETGRSATWHANSGPAVAPRPRRSGGSMTSGQRALVSSIKRTGTTITFSTCSDDKSMGWFAYHVGTMRGTKIQICSNVATTTADQWETLRHEAVHLAQKCENPKHGETHETLTSWSFLKSNASESDAAFIQRAYPKAKWLIELEAFTLMKRSNQTIANLVNRACR